MDSAKIYYLAPDHPHPSWGMALLYHHVRLLRRSGFDASIVHRTPPFRLEWLDVEVPILYLESDAIEPGGRDIVVVPEVLAATADAGRFPCRRFVFVQGAFLIHPSLGAAPDLASLGYQRALAVLPHAQEIVERHYGLAADVVPPFVADHFFPGPDHQGRPDRARRILMFPKEGYRGAGFHDYDIASRLLRRGLSGRPGWELEEVAGVKHTQVSALMKDSAFLVSVNCLEAFNTTVPEAMAAGCIPVCFEAYGGRDFLRDGENAFVFPNNYVYPLVERLLQLVDSFDGEEAELTAMRRRAERTARVFSEERTEAELARVFAAQLGGAGTGAPTGPG